MNRVERLVLAFVALSVPMAGHAVRAAEQTVPAGEYVVDPDHTQIIFGIRHMGLSMFYGRFGRISGSLTFDPASPEKSVLDATIDMTDISTHVPRLDRTLESGSVFNAAKFPVARFHATSIAVTGANTGTVTGDLTIRDVTKPVMLNVVFDGGKRPLPFAKYRIGFDATAVIRRSDFGITPTFWSSMVSDDVTLQIEAEFEKN